MSANSEILVAQRTSRLRWLGALPGGIFALGVGYFLWYTPYSGLAKSLSGGLLPGLDGPVGGLVLLPASALGMLVAMPVFLLGSGWWRYAGRRQVGPLSVPFPARHTAASAAWMSLIVGTTTLNFTFTGFSIVFMLVMMRIETIVLAPIVDLVRRRRIHAYSWAALGISLLTGIIAFTDVKSYRLSLGAAASLLTYLAGYSGRFEIMSRRAKSGQPSDRRYFVEEHMSTPIILTGLLGVLAVIGPVVSNSSALQALHEGFTTFLTTPAAGYAFAIGVCYEGLFIFTTLIFLDPREYAFCVPVHVCSSLLAGIAAALAMRGLFGTPAPSPASLASAICVIAAACALSYPLWRARWLAAREAATEAVLVTATAVPASMAAPAGTAGVIAAEASGVGVSTTAPTARQLLVFVCGGNTSRSVMAEAIARAELAAAGLTSSWDVTSAGLDPVVDAPVDPVAAAILRERGILVGDHHARELTVDLINAARAVYCMGPDQHNAVRDLAPNAGATVACLDPDGDIPNPHGQPRTVYYHCFDRIREQVVRRFTELGLTTAPAT